MEQITAYIKVQRGEEDWDVEIQGEAYAVPGFASYQTNLINATYEDQKVELSQEEYDRAYEALYKKVQEEL